MELNAKMWKGKAHNISGKFVSIWIIYNNAVEVESEDVKLLFPPVLLSKFVTSIEKFRLMNFWYAIIFIVNITYVPNIE